MVAEYCYEILIFKRFKAPSFQKVLHKIKGTVQCSYKEKQYLTAVISLKKLVCESQHHISLVPCAEVRTRFFLISLVGCVDSHWPFCFARNCNFNCHDLELTLTPFTVQYSHSI